MRVDRGWLCVGVASLAAGSAAMGQSGAMFVPLGELPGGVVDSWAVASSPRAQQIVGGSIGPFGIEATLWLPGQPPEGLGDLPGGDFFSIGESISDDGRVVVGVGNSAAGQEAFRWTRDQGMVGLGDLPGGAFSSYANRVSPDGQFVVGRSEGELGDEAFLWHADTGMQGLGILPGGTFSIAWGVADGGDRVVGLSESAGGNVDGFIWRRGEGMQPFGPAPSSPSPYVVFACDQCPTCLFAIVGGATSPESWPELEAFRYSEDLGFQMLGDLPGGNYASIANTLSDDGEVVVGDSHTGVGPHGIEAFIWTPDLGMRNLREHLADLGEPMDGWVLHSAYGISPDGSAIVGWAQNPDGNPEAFLAIIPRGTCRADLDGDGVLTIFDFLEFQNLFIAGDLRADFDGNGVLNIFDFLAFQNEFAMGCP